MKERGLRMSSRFWKNQETKHRPAQTCYIIPVWEKGTWTIPTSPRIYKALRLVTGKLLLLQESNLFYSCGCCTLEKLLVGLKSSLSLSVLQSLRGLKFSAVASLDVRAPIDRREWATENEGLPKPQHSPPQYSAHAASDKVPAARTHVVRRHNHRGAKNRGTCSLQCFRSSLELLLFLLSEVLLRSPRGMWRCYPAQ